MVNKYYKVRCPECNMAIKKVNDISEIPTEPFICYDCEKEIVICEEDIQVVFLPDINFKER